MKIQFQSAVIFVKDIARSRQFYEGLLQQKVAMDHGLNVGFEAGFALWQVDHARQTIFGAADGSGSLGQRVFRVYDPDGHIVELGEPMPVVILRFVSQGMSAEAIAQRTSMPVPIVQQIIQAA
jgi:catechol 2,3-dioxygenase-like lactoylglutathione lyase family enzyme